MEEIIKWIIENKELVIIACITISVSIPISVHFGKTIINKNRTTYNYRHPYQNPPNKRKSTQPSTNTQVNKQSIELKKILLYSTGKKGKVYTKTFHKQMNYNFGIEITLKNNTYTIQNVKVGWCIYKNGKELMKGTFNKEVNANYSLTTDFYVEKQAFNNLKPGRYKSQFWVNNKRVQKVYFTIKKK